MTETTAADITEKLRAIDAMNMAAMPELCREAALQAAAEIERLRAEIIRLKAMVPAWKLIHAGYPDNFTHETP